MCTVTLKVWKRKQLTASCGTSHSAATSCSLDIFLITVQFNLVNPRLSSLQFLPQREAASRVLSSLTFYDATPSIHFTFGSSVNGGLQSE
jgi:hypothetical protein